VKLTPRSPARRFRAGEVEIDHVADITLEADEQVTFVAPSGSELDVVRKTWGYYATSSLNGRLAAHGLHAVLVRAEDGRAWLLLVEAGNEAEFERYREREKLEVVAWLDTERAVSEMVDALR
jgi:hypothetical protein